MFSSDHYYYYRELEQQHHCSFFSKSWRGQSDFSISSLFCLNCTDKERTAWIHAAIMIPRNPPRYGVLACSEPNTEIRIYPFVHKSIVKVRIESNRIESKFAKEQKIAILTEEISQQMTRCISPVARMSLPICPEGSQSRRSPPFLSSSTQHLMCRHGVSEKMDSEWLELRH